MLYPFIRFNDSKGQEAMNFYKDCFGGELEVMKVKDSPMAKDIPADKQENIMHSMLKSDKATFIGMDMMRDKAVIGDNVGISIDCESDEQLRDYFTKLSAGGDVFMAPEMQFWGGLFAVLTDKYGVEWMLNYQKEPMK